MRARGRREVIGRPFDGATARRTTEGLTCSIAGNEMQCLRRVVCRRPWLSHETSWTVTSHACGCGKAATVRKLTAKGRKSKLHIYLQPRTASRQQNHRSPLLRTAAPDADEVRGRSPIAAFVRPVITTRADSQVLYVSAGIRFHQKRFPTPVTDDTAFRSRGASFALPTPRNQR